jgi:hypothetical protein
LQSIAKVPTLRLRECGMALLIDLQPRIHSRGRIGMLGRGQVVERLALELIPGCEQVTAIRLKIRTSLHRVNSPVEEVRFVEGRFEARPSGSVAIVAARAHA